MKIVAITQRVDIQNLNGEKRDCLDSNWYKLFEELGIAIIILPNNINLIDRTFSLNRIDGIILSGGGDLYDKDNRLECEQHLINISIKRNLPLVGVCRGMQSINSYFGGIMTRIKGHVRSRHKIKLINREDRVVNSFHNFSIQQDNLGENLISLAYDQDNNVELFKHSRFKIYGMMWHPERQPRGSLASSALTKAILH